MRERELRKEGRELPSPIKLRGWPIGVRITLGQPTMGLYPWVGSRPPAFVSWPFCSCSYAIEVLWAFIAFCFTMGYEKQRYVHCSQCNCVTPSLGVTLI